MEQKSFFDKNTILVIMICLGIWWGWQQYLEKKYPETMGGTASQEKTPSSNGSNLSDTNTSQTEGGAAQQVPAAAGGFAEKGEAYTSQNAVKTPNAEKEWNFEDKVWRVE